MKKRYITLAVIILFLNVILISSVGDNSKVDSEVYRVLEKQDEVKVVVEIKEPRIQKGFIVKENKTPEEIKLEKEQIKEKIKGEVGEVNIRHEFENHISMEVSEAELEKLKANKDIELIVPVEKVEAFLQDSVPLINATRTWPLQVNNSNLTGIGETVCILDTGINFSHPDLYGKNKTACLINCLGGTCAQDCNIYDDHGHATHVAGIVGASPSIYGVAISVNLIGVKVLYSDGSGDFDDVAAGISWCANNAAAYNISVISMSLGTNCVSNPELCYSSYCDSQPISSLSAPAIDNAVAHNVSVIIASGNNGNTQYISAPACIKNATAVGTTDKSDGIWAGTNRNNLLDLLAPGVSINSTSRFGGYETRTGTSMATPHVAGAFAILSQLYKIQNNRNATPFEIQNVLNITGRKINDGGTGLNFSRIDIYSAILYLDSIAPSVNLISPLNNYFTSSNNMTFNCSGNDWQLSNVTFYLWNSSNSLIYNETRIITGTSNNTLFNYTLENKNYKWNCLIKDLKGNFAFANSNNSLYVNILAVNLISPSNQTYIRIGSSLINNTNFSCNISRGEYGTLKNVTFYLWNSTSLVYNNSKNITGTSNLSVFFYNLSKDENYNWNCFAYNNYSNLSFSQDNNTLFYDITNPVISDVSSSSSTSSASISFTTNENCNYSINYGTTANNLGTLISDSNFSPNHLSSLSGLSASTIYYYNISYCDFVGNCLSNGTFSFTTSANTVQNLGGSGGSSGGNSGGRGGGGVSNLPIVYSLTSSEINSGVVKQIKEKESLKFLINNFSHSIIINIIAESYVKLTVLSNPLNLTLLIGDEKKLNLTSSEYYDIYIRLNSISNKSASLTVRNIRENITLGSIEAIKNINEDKKEQNIENQPLNAKQSFWIILGIGIIFIVIFIIIITIIAKIIGSGKKSSNKNKLKEYKNILDKKSNKKYLG